MSVQRPYSKRTVLPNSGYSRQLTLPKDALDEFGVSRGDDISATYHPQEDCLEVFSDVDDMQLRILNVGGSLGITIPAAIRYDIDIQAGDVVFADCTGDSLRLRF